VIIKKAQTITYHNPGTTKRLAVNKNSLRYIANTIIISFIFDFWWNWWFRIV